MTFFQTIRKQHWRAHRQDLKIERLQTESTRERFKTQDARKINSRMHKKQKTNSGKIEKLQTELNDVRLQDAQKLADMERRITQDVRPQALNWTLKLNPDMERRITQDVGP